MVANEIEAGSVAWTGEDYRPLTLARGFVEGAKHGSEFSAPGRRFKEENSNGILQIRHGSQTNLDTKRMSLS